MSIDAQVDSVSLFILHISFIILLSFMCSVLMPCTFLLLHYDVNIMYVCVESRLPRHGWMIRPRPKTVILVIQIN